MSDILKANIKVLSDSVLSPKSHNTKSTEGKSVRKAGKATAKDMTQRKAPSESVGSNSLPGWVKKNVGHIEVTEGRL
tara:strand:+ start:3730 stop:3960 length:231 start_codon:yes stop_codon:yes gene_type:complete